MEPERRLDIARVTRQGAARLARRLRAERSPSPLSPGKIGVLAHLARFGPATPGDIAGREHQQPQSLTRLLAELEADGLLTRTRSAVDRRQSLLQLTSAGRDALDADLSSRDRWLAAALAGLTDAEAELVGLAAALMDRLADATPEPERPATPE
ncbi:MarR family winged helix-turn-helix transcriptional regulator [Kutzneria sp. CA-103260]|uniref:MarR family winged helix-turn-helix transcriptional regulator n=1 Tax=Kutzneria sp. CA-103260 TaxID=2802641 RepID=UPI001BEF0B95|nr:MarR family transcriptional regulator [Kutzneria sp. CA-103260]QUQ68625.1 putative HTH-type transcriptional regulator [Kutzneria sp. CA-103260]